MSLFRKFIAVVLLALWLPATQHCGLEAAGLMPEDSHGTEAACCATSDPCAHDACTLMESGLVKTSTLTVKVPTPQLVDFTHLVFLQLLSAFQTLEPESTIADNGQPKHWVPVWQFVRRAALLSRAPSVVG